MKKVLITGGAGFIGSHVVDRLLSLGHTVTNIDNFHNFYDRKIKEANISEALKHPNYTLIEKDINEISSIETETKNADVIIHLAARAGVRPSILDPLAYYNTNVNGTIQLLEFARRNNIKKFINASSSSVYGVNKNTPWKEDDLDLLPISPYAASKIAAEKICYTYSQLYDINVVVLRFFTVYGPRQRPDLAIHKFVKAIDAGTSIEIYGDGGTSRDYTYIDDIVDGICSALNYEKSKFEIFNLGNSATISLRALISQIEVNLNREAIKMFKDEQPGDVSITNADINKSAELLSYAPRISIQKGISEFVTWYKNQQLNS
jgi:UDP-glucuronate 4-epimerase